MSAAQAGSALARRLEQGVAPAILALLFGALALWVPGFASRGNLVALAVSVSMVGMVACSMAFCLASGDFDLSVEAVVMAAGICCALVIGATNSITAGVAAALAFGTAIGLLNGLVIARLGINALITTLATMQIARGLAFIACQGRAVSIPVTDFFWLGSGRVLGLPVPVWITLACMVVFGVLLHRTTFGRQTLAIGGNREAARLSGLPVVRLRVLIFTVQGLVAALAGCVLAARLQTGQPHVAEGFALDCISACVLGGVSLTGGAATIWGVVGGVLLMGAVQNAMDLCYLQPYYQYLVRGLILLGAVLLDRWRRRARRSER